LQAALDGRIAARMEQARYVIPHGDGSRLAWLYAHGEVIARDDAEDAISVTVRLHPADRSRFEREMTLS
jgi:GTP-binding protein HflX